MIPGGTANGTSSYAAFSSILDLASKLTTGFIVLEHDLYQQTVEMAIGYFLPLATQRSFTVRDSFLHIGEWEANPYPDQLKAIYECLSVSLASTYIETAGGSTPPGNSTSGALSSTTSGSVSGSQPTGTSSNPTGTRSLGEGQATQTTGAASARVSLSFSSSILVGGVCSLAMMVFGMVALL